MSAAAVEMLTLKVPRALFRRLDRAARQRGQTRSRFVREAIVRSLEPRPAKRKIVPRKGSLLDLAGDLVGAFDGPPDLSTNPKYMEGFGR